MERRAWRPLGFVRLGDYCEERPGISARSLQEMARVYGLLARTRRFRIAFHQGALGWSALRVLARLSQTDLDDADEERWIAWARRLPQPSLAAAVSAELRRAAAGAGAPGVEPATGPEIDDEDEAMERVGIRCASEVRAKWFFACELARRVVGRRLPIGECADVIAAEVGSGLRVDPRGLADLHEPARPGAALRDVVPVDRGLRPLETELETKTRETSEAPAVEPPIEEETAALLRGLDDASAFELDRRLRRAFELERTQEARMGPLLRTVLEGGLHRRAGYWDRDRYVEQHLGLCARKARALLRIERAAGWAPALEAAYRAGQLSWVQTQAVVGLVEAGLRGALLEAWVRHAQQVSARRLTDDVRAALALRDTDAEAFARTGGLPRFGVEAAGSDGEAREPDPDRQTGAHGNARGDAPEKVEQKVELGFRARPEVGRFFRCVLDSVRDLLAERVQAPVSEGRALDAMLDHVIAVWCARDGRERAQHRILARDGYRCATPGCSSYRNLEVHHIVFRSAGGSDDPENLVTLCAWHHQKALHGGLIRCWGTAPDGLYFALGLRHGQPPLVTYGPGEVILSRGDP